MNDRIITRTCLVAALALGAGQVGAQRTEPAQVDSTRSTQRLDQTQRSGGLTGRGCNEQDTAIKRITPRHVLEDCGAREHATVTKTPPPVTAASTSNSAALSPARAAPLSAGSATQALSAATPTQSSPQSPVATLTPTAPDPAKWGKGAPVASHATPFTSSTIGERARTPQLQAATIQVQPRLAPPPEIVAPAPRSHFPKGKLVVQVRNPIGAAGGSAEVEFGLVYPMDPPSGLGSPFDTRPSSPAPDAAFSPPPPIVWRVSMAELVRGAAVPVSARPNLPGYWHVRVRSIGGRVPGDWSAPVPFSVGDWMGIKPDAAALNPLPPPKTSSSQAQSSPQSPVATLNAPASDPAKWGKGAPVVSHAMPSTSSNIRELARAPKLQAATTHAQPRFLPPLEIVAPASNSEPQGKLHVQVRVRAGGDGGSAEVEFTRFKSAHPLSTSYDPIVWQVSMAKLVRGAAVPVSARPDGPGHWRVRVRSVSDGRAPGDWSAPVRFYLSDFLDGEPDPAALNPQLPPKTSSALPQQQPRMRDLKQVPSTLNR